MAIRLATEKEYQAHIIQREQMRAEKREKRAQEAVERKEKRVQSATERRTQRIQRWEQEDIEKRKKRKEIYRKLRAGGYRITPRIRYITRKALLTKYKGRPHKKRKRKRIKGKKIWKKLRKIKLI